MARQRRRKQAAGKAFQKGCWLAGCLMYLGAMACMAIAFGVFFGGVLGAVMHRAAPDLTSAPVISRFMLRAAPVWALALIGSIQLAQVIAVWRGYRWGVYGLAMLTVSLAGLALAGAPSLAAAGAALWREAWRLVPLALLLLLIRPRWKAMA